MLPIILMMALLCSSVPGAELWTQVTAFMTCNLFYLRYDDLKDSNVFRLEPYSHAVSGTDAITVVLGVNNSHINMADG